MPPLLKLIKYPQDPMATHFLCLRKTAHRPVSRKKYRSLRLGEGEREAVVNRNAPLQGSQSLRICPPVSALTSNPRAIRRSPPYSFNSFSYNPSGTTNR
jgi:hypothetical protein